MGLLSLLILALTLGLSWIVTCGLVYLVTLCFGLAFSWGVATGVWAIMLLLKAIFGGK